MGSLAARHPHATAKRSGPRCRGSWLLDLLGTNILERTCLAVHPAVVSDSPGPAGMMNAANVIGARNVPASRRRERIIYAAPRPCDPGHPGKEGERPEE